MDINYTHPIGDDLKMFVGGSMAYRSKTSAQLAASSIWDIDAYTVYDAQLGLGSKDDGWRAWIWGKNLTNKYYWTNVTKTGDIALRYPGMAATYGITAAFKWR